jgi:predicted Zn finger-like uncharacterized protein
MRTRCPACRTVFRVTAEQLRLKSGKVRCGYCHAVFNALDELIDDQSAQGGIPPAAEQHPPPAGSTAVDALECLQMPDAKAAEGDADAVATPGESEGAADDESRAGADLDPGHPDQAPDVAYAAAPHETPPEIQHEVVQDVAREEAVSTEPAVPEEAPAGVKQPADPDGGAGNVPEASATTVAEGALPIAATDLHAGDDEAERARAAGLVAARELSETPGYNRWADGVLSGGPGGFAGAEKRTRWPYLLAAALLLVGLLAQTAYAWRVELVRRVPDAGAAFELLGIEVPLSGDTELISIESSDLQSEQGRGLLVLNALLRNRAAYAQEWPLLELTLTDTADTVIARRVLAAKDYLPPGADLSAFPPGSEAPVRIWLDAKGLGAGGYRLFVFYP